MTSDNKIFAKFSAKKAMIFLSDFSMLIAHSLGIYSSSIFSKVFFFCKTMYRQWERF